MPFDFVRWGESWADLHPNWTMKLWNEDNIVTKYGDLLSRCPHLSQQSNILRYEILHREGGVYLDTDFECKRNIESLIEDLSFFAAREDENYVAAGIIGTKIGHEVFGRMLSDAANEPVEVSTSLGVPFFTKYALQYGCKVFPRNLFYPYKWTEMERRFDSFDEAYAVHHWSSMWYPSSRLALTDEQRRYQWKKDL